jgi:hypothetical protein
MVQYQPLWPPAYHSLDATPNASGETMTRPMIAIPARRNFTNVALMAEVVAMKRARMENAGYRVVGADGKLMERVR